MPGCWVTIGAESADAAGRGDWRRSGVLIGRRRALPLGGDVMAVASGRTTSLSTQYGILAGLSLKK